LLFVLYRLVGRHWERASRELLHQSVSVGLGRCFGRSGRASSTHPVSEFQTNPPAAGFHWGGRKDVGHVVRFTRKKVGSKLSKIWLGFTILVMAGKLVVHSYPWFSLVAVIFPAFVSVQL